MGNYNGYSGNVTGWITDRPKMGGKYRLAPVMMDRIQCTGSGLWVETRNGQSAPGGVHRNSSGVPTGGNFLYEDGHVSWEKFAWMGRFTDSAGTIGIGAKGNNDIDYFVPARVGYGPW
jgi:hypothetical protein